jgi:hypothetical protein
MSRLPPRSSITRNAPVLGVALLVLSAIAWPLVFTYSGFSGDWEHQLWLVWHQSLSIKSAGLPSLYLNSSYSVFYPMYAFYGGTLFALGGLLSLALGEAPVQAYVLIYLLDLVAAFGGWYWLGRIAGLSRWAALVPGLVFVTSTYYLVVVYVQGDWPAFTGISMISLMVAAGLSVLRAARLRVSTGLVLAMSSILFFGSHNITILLGLTTLAITALAVVVCVPDARRAITLRGVMRLAAVVIPSALVSAWYLLPALAYHSSTRIGSEFSHARETLKSTVGLVSTGHLFTFSRTYGPGLPPPYYLALSLPVLAIVWVLAGLFVLPWGARNRAWVRMLLICSAIAVLVTVVMTHVGLLLALPRPFTLIQFSYRLETYVLLALCGAILAALVLAQQRSWRVQLWTWLAIPVCAVSIFGAIQQLRGYPYPGQDRYATLESYGEVETGNNKDFQDVSEPLISGHGLPTIEIPAEAVHSDRVSFTVRVRPGALVATNIGAGSPLMRITGAKAVGVDSETGDMVLQVGSRHSATAATAATADPRGKGASPRGKGASNTQQPEATISVSSANSLPIALGRILSLAAVAVLVLGLFSLVARQLLPRRSRRQ